MAEICDVKKCKSNEKDLTRVTIASRQYKLCKTCLENFRAFLERELYPGEEFILPNTVDYLPYIIRDGVIQLNPGPSPTSDRIYIRPSEYTITTTDGSINLPASTFTSGIIPAHLTNALSVGARVEPHTCEICAPTEADMVDAVYNDFDAGYYDNVEPTPIEDQDDQAFPDQHP